MATQSTGQQVYPFYPPQDQQIKYDQDYGILKKNPFSKEKAGKFCPICDFPIHIRMVIFPCSHYFCYKCYTANISECRICDEVIKESQRIDDNENFYSCDLDNCHKYFENESKYLAHAKQHEEISSKDY